MTATEIQLQTVPLADVIIDPNVRRTVDVDKSFISSIRNYGILQPPVGWRDDAGKIHITMGQRRTVAAQKIGLDTIPVILKSQQDAEQMRIIEQLAENEQRADLNTADTTAAYAQLAFEFGVTPEQIARKTNSPKAKVDTALAVGSSTAASTAAAHHKITLEQAAIYAEFDDDEAAIARLNETAADNPDQLAHTAQRIREDHLDQEVVDRLTQLVVDAGAELVEWDEFEKAHRIAHLYPVGKPSERLTLDDVKGLDGLVAKLHKGYSGDADRGYTLYWALRDPKAHGFTGYSVEHGGGRGPLTDEQKAERAQKRLDRKEMAAATVVRREWIAEYLSNKLSYEDVAGWIAHAAIGTATALASEQASRYSAQDLAAQLLGITNGDSRGHLSRYIEKGKTQDTLAATLAYAIALAEYPAGHDKHHAFGQWVALAPYLEQLQAWGYTLADVEQRIIAAAKKRAR